MNIFFGGDTRPDQISAFDAFRSFTLDFFNLTFLNVIKMTFCISSFYIIVKCCNAKKSTFV